MLDESIYHVRGHGIGSVLSFFFLFLMEILLAHNLDPDQTPQHVASDFQVRMG